MKKIKLFTLSIAFGLFFIACSNNKSGQDSDKSSTESQKVEKNIKRPEKSEEKAGDKALLYDAKVGELIETVGKVNESIDKGKKMTPTIEKNVSDLITEIKKIGKELTPLTDSLSEDDYGLFTRDKESLREYETRFETLK